MMTERAMIHIGGSPGSGKSRMARALVEHLHTYTDLRAEHISVGNRLRLIGQQAIHSMYEAYISDHLADPAQAHLPMNDEVVEAVTYEALNESNRRNAQIVLLDGYPRYPTQVSTYFELAAMSQRDTPGALITDLNEDQAMVRMLKRGDKHQDRSMTDQGAEERMRLHDAHYPETLLRLGEYTNQFMIYPIDTSGPKQHTDNQALEATMRLIGQSLPKSA